MNNEKKLAAITGLPAAERYSYFIKTVADSQSAWGLYDDGWALSATDDGVECFLLWPSMDTAGLSITGDWLKYQTKQIDVSLLIDELIPKLKIDGLSVAVFPTPGDKGVIANMDQLVIDLKEELRRY
jgi:hypothetical protein